MLMIKLNISKLFASVKPKKVIDTQTSAHREYKSRSSREQEFRQTE